MMDTDCTGALKACLMWTCDMGVCKATNISSGVLAASQVYGDCRKTLCDGNGGFMYTDDPNDFYDDGNECTLNYCDMGTPMTDTVSNGTACMMGTGYCDGLGNCVNCLVTGQCMMNQTCQAHNCVPTTCTNLQKDGTETDVDCGGPCNPCADGKSCGQDADCASKKCTVGFLCAAPTCQDGVHNGAETAVDCGGLTVCARCTSGQTCGLPSDCVSNVCIKGLCAPPSCTDGVKNGNEKGVDCGGACAPC